MYEKYFGFNLLPFSITPDPRFYFDTPSCREAMAGLRYGVEGRRGFIVITGEPGTGKTRLVKDYLQRANASIRAAFINTPILTVTQLLRLALIDLRIAPCSQDRGELTLQLKDFLLEQYKKQHVVALLVDEAQHLSDEVLEELRLLSNLETNEDKLLQIVLVGQPELEQRLGQPELRQVMQRVALRCRLERLEAQEVSLYIQARLKAVGFKEKALFDAKAVETIVRYSNGNPRLINLICECALLNCYGLSKKTVSTEIIEEVACDLHLTVERPNEKLNVNRQDGNAVAALNSVSRRPIGEEIQDVFTAGEQRRNAIPRQRSLSSLAAGFVLGVLAAGLGMLLNFQSSRSYLSEVGARIWAQTNWREIVTTGAVEPVVLHQDRSNESKDVQIEAAGKPPMSTQPTEGIGMEARATGNLEAGNSGSSRSTDAPDRPQAKPPAKNDAKNQVATVMATKGTSVTRFEVGQKSANDRLEFEIHRAIAKHAIRGVEVSVIDGTVVLGGRVNTENKKIAAAKAARNVPGVVSIRDQIIVTDDTAL